MAYKIIITGTSPNTFPPMEYRLNNFSAIPICNSWSGSRPMILFTSALLIFARKDGIKININGIMTANTDDLVFADTSMHKEEINRHPIYPPKTIRKYSCRFVT